MPKRNKHISTEDEVDQLSIDTFMTVFWPKTRNENMYITDFLGVCNCILNADLSTITEKEYENIKEEYNAYYKNIARFSECVNILLSNRLYQKYKLYKNSFLDKIEVLYKYMLTQHVIIDQTKFLEFMYENTVEGRIIVQNSATIKDLEVIEATRDHLILINNILHPTVINKKEAIELGDVNQIIVH